MFAAALAGSVEHRLQQFPLVIGQVTWVRHAPHGDVALDPGNRDTPSETLGPWERRFTGEIDPHEGTPSGLLDAYGFPIPEWRTYYDDGLPELLLVWFGCVRHPAYDTTHALVRATVDVDPFGRIMSSSWSSAVERITEPPSAVTSTSSRSSDSRSAGSDTRTPSTSRRGSTLWKMRVRRPSTRSTKTSMLTSDHPNAHAPSWLASGCGCTRTDSNPTTERRH